MSLRRLWIIPNIFFHIAHHVKARHALLKGAIGTFPEEDYGFDMVNSLSWILPLAIVMGSLVDIILVYVYMRYAHQWKDILSSEEVLSPRLESQTEESNQPSNEISTEQPDKLTVESPLGCQLRCHPDMLKHNPKNWQKNSC